MSAGKNKSKKQAKPRSEKTEIDYEKLGHAIASALIEADSIKEKQRKKEDEYIKEERRKIRGEKECPPNAGWIGTHLCQLRNDIVLFRNLFFISEKDAEHFSGATIFAQNLLEAIFSACECLLYIVAIFAFIMMIFSFKMRVVAYIVLFFLLSGLSFMYARLFRLAKFEVKYMKDRNYMISFLSAIASFFAMIFALIGLVGGIIHGI